MFEKPARKEEGTANKINNHLRDIGTAAVLAGGLLIAPNSEAGVRENAGALFDELKEIENAAPNMSKNKSAAENVNKEGKYREKVANPDVRQRASDQYEAMDEIIVLDEKYSSAKEETDRDKLRQEIARTLLKSEYSATVLAKDGGHINGRFGRWTIDARSNGKMVTGTIVSSDGAEKSMFAFLIH
jgi:murein DD-endopeptidase MepM/ murein hydrolase activator NlpD